MPGLWEMVRCRLAAFRNEVVPVVSAARVLNGMTPRPVPAWQWRFNFVVLVAWQSGENRREQQRFNWAVKMG